MIALSIEKQKKWRTKKSGSSYREDEESFGMANTKKSKKYTRDLSKIFPK